MLKPLCRAFAALAVPLLRPLLDALAEEWTRDEEEDSESERSFSVGFGLPDQPEQPGE
jgi:hypothetical protein